MSWWNYIHEGSTFSWFGAAHITVWLIIIFLSGCIILGRDFLSKKGSRNFISFVYISLFLLSELSFQAFYITNGIWDISYSLPLHLSSIAWITSVLTLLTKHNIWFEITFLAGLGSAVLALLTPDLAAFGFPHYRFFHFFLTHGLVILVVFYLLFVEKMFISFRSVFRVWGILNIYALAVFFFNLAIDGNYMYLMNKPAQTTPFDWFGPWPYYIISLEIFTISMFLLIYGVYKAIFFVIHVKLQ
ncbi:TIGR02206 family membrane protein [Salibacterium salarium]|uniref:TIGR02206 family membrane protein n=1 Tax=Salibacterium salarium TaxID=284579 RepID=A0A3R9PNR1_9BACI|nr:TIGR02206 family membrane protein [Salibacterium salarium]RSL34884.1 TIGR02206 family membrane protein [Salibacterium salarium]